MHLAFPVRFNHKRIKINKIKMQLLLGLDKLNLVVASNFYSIKKNDNILFIILITYIRPFCNFI